MKNNTRSRDKEQRLTRDKKTVGVIQVLLNFFFSMRVKRTERFLWRYCAWWRRRYRIHFTKDVVERINLFERNFLTRMHFKAEIFRTVHTPMEFVYDWWPKVWQTFGVGTLHMNTRCIYIILILSYLQFLAYLSIHYRYIPLASFNVKL